MTSTPAAAAATALTVCAEIYTYGSDTELEFYNYPNQIAEHYARHDDIPSIYTDGPRRDPMTQPQRNQIADAIYDTWPAADHFVLRFRVADAIATWDRLEPFTIDTTWELVEKIDALLRFPWIEEIRWNHAGSQQGHYITWHTFAPLQSPPPTNDLGHYPRPYTEEEELAIAAAIADVDPGPYAFTALAYPHALEAPDAPQTHDKLHETILHGSAALVRQISTLFSLPIIREIAWSPTNSNFTHIVTRHQWPADYFGISPTNNNS